MEANMAKKQSEKQRVDAVISKAVADARTLRAEHEAGGAEAKVIVLDEFRVWREHRQGWEWTADGATADRIYGGRDVAGAGIVLPAGATDAELIDAVTTDVLQREGVIIGPAAKLAVFHGQDAAARESKTNYRWDGKAWA
jgi:hypothetical protein